jgi:hypothetical protein
MGYDRNRRIGDDFSFLWAAHVRFDWLRGPTLPGQDCVGLVTVFVSDAGDAQEDPRR